MKTIFSFILVLGAALATFAETPKGLSDSDWSSIRAAYEAGRHRFFELEDGSYAARNPGLGWRMTFDGRGFTATPDDGGWSWGLELEGAENGPVTLQGNKLTVQRGAHLEEWFINDGRGLEQGWTVRERVGAADRIRLSMAVRGGMKPSATSSGVTFGDGVITYAGLKAWDATGRVLPARFLPDAERVFIEVDDAGAQYPVTIDPIAQNAYLKASNTEGGDGFGWSVAVSGNTVVVGAGRESSSATGINGNQADNSALFSGAAYVFVRSGFSWSQQAFLKASNADTGHFFGESVAISGDTIVVGARDEDSGATGVNGDQTNNSATNSGAAYVFVRSGDTWFQQAYLKASNTGAFDRFGGAVATSGNIVVVGAEQEDSIATGVNGDQSDNGAGSAGAAYVFVRRGSTWSQQAYLKASNTEATDLFGRSVAVSGDTIVVGASGEDSSATGINGDQTNNSAASSGAAYVFTRSRGIWSQQAYLKASNAGAGDNFGFSVAVSGDTVVAGAWFEDSNATGINGDQTDNSATNSGAAYVFTRSGGTWSQQAYLKASNTGMSDFFGESVAVSGDIVAVGASAEDSDATGINGNQADDSAGSSGAAYLFARMGGVWSQLAYLKASNTGAADEFGQWVAVSGDTVVVGALGEASNATGVNGDQANNSAAGSGAAYLFSIGEVLNTLSKTNHSAAGAPDLTFSRSGAGALSPLGETLFESRLVGTGATRGRSRAMFSNLSGTVDLVLQTGTNLSGLAGLPFGAKISSVTNPLHNRSTSSGVFQATVRGRSLNGANNRILFQDNGAFVSPLIRTGQPVAELGGALPRHFNEVLQAEGASDLLAINYLLKTGAASVTRSSDSGLLLMNHTGTVTHFTAREGQAAFGGGTFGQLGRATMADFDVVHFLAKWFPASGGKALNSLFFIGATDGRSPVVQGVPANGTSNGELFRSFTGLTRIAALGLVRATLSGSPSNANEGLWIDFNQLLLRKGQDIGGGLRVTRILRAWGNNSFQVIAQVRLGGTGVNGSNNQALILRQIDGNFLILLRSGQPAPGIGLGKVTLRTIQAVDVDPISGHYAVLGSLRGAPSFANQALWSGQTTLGNDTTLQHQRLPWLCLQKGELYHTEKTPGDIIRSISLKPAVDRSGVSGRGLAQVTNSNGQILLTLTGNRRAKELVLLTP